MQPNILLQSKFTSFLYEGWNFNSGNDEYLFTTDTK